MAHSNNIISKIQLPGSETVYEIHDEHAIHDADLASAMEFKGSVETYDELPASPENGDVYLVTSNGNEYVWGNTSAPDTEESEKVYGWIELGTPLAADHTHSFSGTTGKQSANTVTGTVTIPTISSTKKYLGASVSHSSNGTGEFLKKDATFTTELSAPTGTTKYVGATASGTAVGANGTATVVTGYAAPTTDSFVKAVTSESAEVVGSISTGTGSAVTGLGTPTSDTFIKSYPGATSSAVTGLGTPSTGAFLTGLDEENPPTTDTFVKSIETPTDTFVKSYPGSSSKLVTTSIAGVSGSTTASKVSSTNANLDTTSITPALANGTAIKTVTPTTGSVTGVSGSTTASKATAGTAVTVATRASSQTTVGNANVGTATTVATGVTGGSAAAWSATVDDGVLTFSFTPNTLQTATTTSITPAATSTTKIYGVGGTESITPYTFTNVTVPKAATAASTFVTGIDTTPTNVATVGNAVTVAKGTVSADGTGATVTTSVTVTDVTVPKAASAKTVATGSVASTGTGSSVLVGLGDPTTGTGIKSITPTTGAAIIAIEEDNFTTGSAVTALGTPTTKSFLTGLGTPTTGTAIKSITPTTGTFVTTVTPTEATVLESIDATSKATALTGLGTASTKSVLTGVKVTAQPTIELALANATATGKVGVLTAVSGPTSATTTASGSGIAITSLNTPTISLTAYDSTGTGRVQYIHDVTTGSTTAALQSGKVADHTHSFSGTTGAPN